MRAGVGRHVGMRGCGQMGVPGVHACGPKRACRAGRWGGPPGCCAGRRDGPTHEFPRTVAEIDSAQAWTHAQKKRDGAEEGHVVASPDERKAEGHEVGQEHGRRRACLTRVAQRYVICAERGGGDCVLVERPM